jgi:hypothetical protein
MANDQVKQHASDIRQFMPNAPTTVMRSSSKTKKRKSKDIRQFGQTKPLQANTIKPPNLQQARILYPKQYKQASIFEYTTRPTDIEQLNIESLTI